MSAGPGACGSVTASPAAAPSISTSCSEPEPTLSHKALWPENEKEEYIFTIILFYYVSELKMVRTKGGSASIRASGGKAPTYVFLSSGYFPAKF